jgi:hypothetical protein|tara:strand:+ start:1129 stop:1401 length:273 start_codon:yes stop_codon:yes gene_type:complete
MKKYPDGEVIPKELPAKYAKAKGAKNCANCLFLVGKNYCSFWGAAVRGNYLCAKWKSKKNPGGGTSGGARTVMAPPRTTTSTSSGGSSGY